MLEVSTDMYTNDFLIIFGPAQSEEKSSKAFPAMYHDAFRDLHRSEGQGRTHGDFEPEY